MTSWILPEHEVYDNLKEVVIKEPCFFGARLLSAFYQFKGYNIKIVSGTKDYERITIDNKSLENQLEAGKIFIDWLVSRKVA